jgi:hypothetical protein
MGTSYNADVMMQQHLSQFEDRIQRLVEGGFARLLAGQLHPHELAIQLAKVMEDRAFRTSDGRLIAPDHYNIRLSPQDHTAIVGAHPDIVDTLATELIEVARIAGVVLVLPPQVKLLADNTIPKQQVGVDAWHTSTEVDSTQSMPPDEIRDTKQASSPAATLILNGDQHIPVDRPILNLGRHRDNHIIIDDPAVSRHHAQIRLRFGKYALFDLGSASGTNLNGCQIQEATLHSGDVITLGNSNLIYIEDSDDDMSTDRLLPTEK